MNKKILIILGIIFVLGCMTIGIGVDFKSFTLLGLGIGMTVMSGIGAIGYACAHA